MPNPVINFRLSPYQIARGLWIVRKLEPNYQPTSVSQLVKLLYIDYLAKMSYGRSDIVPAELVQEVKMMLNPGKQQLTLDDLMKHKTPLEKVSPFDIPADEKSSISTATDLSPNADWLTSLTDED